jgi:hypothetical protein
MSAIVAFPYSSIVLRSSDFCRFRFLPAMLNDPSILARLSRAFSGGGLVASHDKGLFAT